MDGKWKMGFQPLRAWEVGADWKERKKKLKKKALGEKKVGNEEFGEILCGNKKFWGEVYSDVLWNMSMQHID